MATTPFTTTSAALPTASGATAHTAFPATVPQWRRAYREGGEPARWLEALRAHLLQHSPPETWIALIGAAELARRLEALEASAATHADRAAMQCAMPLYGVPFAVKDNIDVAGFATTAACPAFAHDAVADAHAVARLLDAGAVCMGKTNLDQFATGLVGARSPYGRPSSTFSNAHISGGSSSGSAVAVSRGDVAFALGTDTAGSGRVPAAFNNVVGLKPTPGRVSTAGVVPACRSIDCVSIFALTIADAAEVLALVEGPDANDAYSAFRPGPGWLAAPGMPSGAPLRIGIPAAPRFGGTAAERASYAAAFEQAGAHARALGAEVVGVDFTRLVSVGQMLYGGPWLAERHATVEALLARDPAALDPTVRRVVEAAAGFSATDTFRAQYALREARRDSAAVWRRAGLAGIGAADVDGVEVDGLEASVSDVGVRNVGDAEAGVPDVDGVETEVRDVDIPGVDLLMVPSAPAHPTHAEIDADPIGANALLGTYTNFVNLLGWCALALPATFTDAGLPFGVTFIAPGTADAALARFGAQWEAQVQLPMGATGRPWQADASTGERDGSAPSMPTPSRPSRAWPMAAPTLCLAVVGAHLAGLPLNGQLVERGARFVEATRTAARYRLFALPNTVPPKPGLSRMREGEPGAAIAVEVWEMPQAAVGSFLALIAPPLGIGHLELADGRWVHGFVCDASALGEARDITGFGGWRAFVQAGAAGA